MPARLRYGQLAPQGLEHMRALEHYLNTASGLPPALLGLLRLRASQMNGCEYCITLHRNELKTLGEPAARIDALSDWRVSPSFSDPERAALAWTEAVTNIQDGHAPDDIYRTLRAHFGEVETTNLTFAITTINAWNRIAIALGNYPGHEGDITLRTAPAPISSARLT